MTEEQTYEQTFPVGPHPELVVKNVRGRVTVRGGQRSDVHVHAVKRLGTYWGAQDAYSHTDVLMQQDDQRITIRTILRQGFNIFGWLGVGRTLPEVIYTIDVPTGCDISVHHIGGTVSIEGVAGSVYIHTVSGDMHLHTVQGTIIVQTVSGTIQGNCLTGRLGAKAVSGAIEVVASALSSAWVKTVSGSTVLETSLEAAGAYSGTSISGSFHLYIPLTSQATIRFHSTSGRARSEIPVTVMEDRRGFWQAHLNGGGATVEISTVSGDLLVAPAPLDVPPAATTSRPESAEATASEEMSILRAVERGELSVDEALKRLAILDKDAPQEERP